MRFSLLHQHSIFEHSASLFVMLFPACQANVLSMQDMRIKMVE